jgi:parallel beta-helix repeat protein
MRYRAILFSLLFAAVPLFADSADIGITPWTDGDRHYAFWVYDFGPDVAKNVVLTVDIPEGLTVYSSSLNCGDPSARPIQCRKDTLQIVGDTVVFDFHVVAPQANATYTMTATTTSDTPDPRLANNTASFTLTTRVTAYIATGVAPLSSRIDPGVPARFVTDLRNYNDSPATNVRGKYLATNGTIESITPSFPLVTCTIASDGASAECVMPQLDEACRCSRDIIVVVRPSAGREGGETKLTLNGTSDLPQDYPSFEASGIVETYRWIGVANVGDAGPGSLRAAFDEANEFCSLTPCKIVFEIPPPVPAEGWFTITPLSPLAPILADRVFIDGKSQRATTGDTNANGPVIAIDGHIAHNGIEMHSSCEAVIRGLSFGGFDADQALWFRENRPCGQYVSDVDRPDRHLITENFIGVDPSGKPWPNLRGVRADGANGMLRDNVISHNTYSGVWMWDGFASLRNNRIENNGASGVFVGPGVRFFEAFGNVIANHPEMGIAVASSARNIDIRENSMKNNGGLAIDWGLDGVTPSGDDTNGPTNPPVVLSASYDAQTNRTLVTFKLDSVSLTPYGYYGIIDFYANDAPDGDGEQWLYSGTTADSDNATHTFAIPGDVRGKWITTTWTRLQWNYIARPAPPRSVTANAIGGSDTMTSEMSNSVKVE